MVVQVIYYYTHYPTPLRCVDIYFSVQLIQTHNKTQILMLRNETLFKNLMICI
jgi:hypothetical protein